MRALRLTGARRLEVVEVPDPAAGPGEAVVRVAATGICGSDLSCYKLGIFAGSVLGHEVAGVVDEPGAGGRQPGDPVVIDPKIPCGACVDCHAGASWRCVEALTLGIGAGRPGGFAERVVVPESLLYDLPPGIDPSEACLVEPLSVALHGITRAGGAQGATAVIVGLGPVGLLTVAALRDAGARRIVGIDPVATRRSLASSLGADETLPPGGEAREAAAGSDLAVEASGRADVLQTTTDLVSPGGRVLLLGVPLEEVTVVPLSWITREVTLIGSVASSDAEFAAAIDLLARRPQIAGIITRRVGLDELPGAFENLLSSGEDGKVAFTPAS